MKVDGLADAINKDLSLYSKSVTDGTKEAVKRVSKEMLQNIKTDAKASGFQGGEDYIGAMALKNDYENANGIKKTWYVKAPFYRLAHLLEFGHATVTGGRARAFPHIKKNEEQATERLEKEIKDIIRKGV